MENKKSVLKGTRKQIVEVCIIFLISLLLYCGVLFVINGGTEGIIDKLSSQVFSSTETTKRVTKENYNKITNGMTENEVNNILGTPTSSSETVMESIGQIRLKHYQEDTKAIQVYFKDGKVYMKNWTEL